MRTVLNQQALTKAVLETILELVRQKPDWQRDALRRIVAGAYVTGRRE